MSSLPGRSLCISLRRRALAPQEILVRRLILRDISCFRWFASHVSSLNKDNMASVALPPSAVFVAPLIDVP